MTTTHENISNELKARKQWVVWQLEERGGKPTKVPYSPATGAKASTTDRSTWCSFEEARTAHEAGGADGIGYVFAPDDPFSGIDFDEITPDVWEMVRGLDSYTEYSQSLEGLHVLVRGKLPPGRRRRGKIEMYDQGRFFVMTGDHVEGTPRTIEDRQPQLEALHRAVFGPVEPVLATGAFAEGASLSDDEVIRAASNDLKFLRLWSGNAGGYDSRSEADQALVRKLSFYTGGDEGQIDRLFRRSGLMREKWDRDDYRASTLANVRDQSEFYSRSVPLTIGGDGMPTGGQAPRPTFKHTDYGNAERLVYEHGQDLRYCYPWKCWLAWDGRRWQQDASGEVMRRAKLTARAIQLEAVETEDADESKTLFRHGKSSEREARLNAMVNLARSEPRIPVLPNELDADPWKLNVSNGTIDLRQGTLQPHHKPSLITKEAPVVHDASAKCLRWLQFLREVFAGNEDLIHYIQKAAGYSMTGSISEQNIFIPYGTGANGKGTFLNTLESTLGDYAQATRPELLMAKPRSGGASEGEAALRGARFVSTTETSSGQKFDEATVKRLTGGDTIRARFLHGNEFEFRPTHKIWLATNHKPVIEGTDHAIWRRIHLIPFNVTFTEEQQDKNLDAKLENERAGILNWMVEGCLLWQREGLNPPQSVMDATAQYRAEMDVLGDFLKDRCETGIKEMQVQASRLHREYKTWCEQTGEKPETQRSFGLRLTERGFERERRRDGYWYRGVGIKTDDDPDTSVNERFTPKRCF